jgi:hypothetical protein
VSNYRVVLRGVLEGRSVDAVAEALSRLSGKAPSVLRPMLASGKTLIAKRTVDVQKAVKYKQALEKIGCRCLIEAEITENIPMPKTDASVTVNLTTNVEARAQSPTMSRQFEYAKTPVSARFIAAGRVLRVKEWIGLAALGVMLYYGWDRIATTISGFPV